MTDIKGSQSMMISGSLTAQNMTWPGCTQLFWYSVLHMQLLDHPKDAAFPEAEGTSAKWYMTPLNTKTQMGTRKLG